MDSVLAGVFTVPLHLTVEIGACEIPGNFRATVALDPPDYVVGRSIKSRPAAMAIEFKFFTMQGLIVCEDAACRQSLPGRAGLSVGGIVTREVLRTKTPGIRRNLLSRFRTAIDLVTRNRCQRRRAKPAEWTRAQAAIAKRFPDKVSPER
jgi:hypothetical protein